MIDLDHLAATVLEAARAAVATTVEADPLAVDFTSSTTAAITGRSARQSIPLRAERIF